MFETTQKRKRYDGQFRISASKVVPSNEMAVQDLSKELDIKDSTLRRRPCEYREMGERLPRQRKPRDRQGPRDRGASQKGRGARARERALKKFPGFLEPGPCARHGFLKAHRGEFGPIGGCELHCPSMRPNSSDMLIVAAAAVLSAGLPPATSGWFRRNGRRFCHGFRASGRFSTGLFTVGFAALGKRRRVVVFRAGSVCETVQKLRGRGSLVLKMAHPNTRSSPVGAGRGHRDY